MSWSSSENISVPTTAPALLRVTVESSRPMEATASRGIMYTSAAAPMSTKPRPTLTRLPDRVVSGCSPDCSPPAATATSPMTTSARAA